MAEADIAAITRLVDAALKGGAGRAEAIEAATIARSSGAPDLDLILDDLAVRAGAGNEEAIELLLELVHRLRLARGAITPIVFDAMLVDDVAQAALIAVEKNISSFEGRAKFRTWLHTVARNEALMAMRKRNAIPTEDAPSDSARFSSVVIGRMAIEDLVATLPEPYGETLRLQLFENMEYDAIAERLGVPVGTVRSRLAKAREMLRDVLALRTR
jgi:RNA polymerase sigma-70 factor (ECF subfamily)